MCAVGARTPLGLTAEASAAAIRAGVTEVTEHPFLVDRMAEPIRMARDSRLDAALFGPDRLIEMGRGPRSLAEVCSSSSCRSDLMRLGRPWTLALPEERPGWNAEKISDRVSGP